MSLKLAKGVVGSSGDSQRVSFISFTHRIVILLPKLLFISKIKISLHRQSFITLHYIQGAGGGVHKMASVLHLVLPVLLAGVLKVQCPRWSPSQTTCGDALWGLEWVRQQRCVLHFRSRSSSILNKCRSLAGLSTGLWEDWQDEEQNELMQMALGRWNLWAPNITLWVGSFT